MAAIIVIEEVEFWKGDNMETLDYRRCEACSEAGYHDLWAGREMRAFYHLPAEGLDICENCLPGILEGEAHAR